MGLNRRMKKLNDAKLESHMTLNELASYMDVLAALTYGALKAAVIKIQNDLKYSLPSHKAEVRAVERKIENRLGDLKIALSGRNDVKSGQIINEINMLIIERNSRL